MSGYRIKPWEELTISDDYMFKLIMSRKRICKQMLERILHIEIEDIDYLETEKTVTARYHSKGIRLDVYVKDDQGTVYNIEMQVRKPEGGRPLEADALLSVHDGCGSPRGRCRL